MKTLAIACLLLVAVALAECARIRREEEKYTDKYDNMDMDEILRNDRLRENYMKCIFDKGPCTPEGNELKNIICDALKTGCSKCNDKQKEAAKKAIDFLTKNKPDELKKIMDYCDCDEKCEEKLKEGMSS